MIALAVECLPMAHSDATKADGYTALLSQRPPFKRRPRNKPTPYHSDAVKAAALAAYDAIGTNDSYAIDRAAGIVHLPRQTVWHWVRRARIPESVQRLRQKNRLALSDRLEEIVHRILDVIPEALDSAPLNQLAVALGISIDKRLLLQGQPNSIQAGVYLTREQRVQALDSIFSRHQADVRQPDLSGASADDSREDDNGSEQT